MKNQNNTCRINNDALMGKIWESKGTIKNFMGYGSREMPPIIERKLEEELAKIVQLLEPIGYYRILSKKESEEFWTYDIFEKRKHKAEKLAILLYTIGSQLEAQIDNYSQNSEMIRGLILDKTGVVALDSLKDILINEIEEKTGLKKIREVYPTNGDFPIKGQALIYNKLQNKGLEIDKITINYHYQLSPIKSVAVAIILGKEEELWDRCRECGACKMEEI